MKPFSLICLFICTIFRVGQPGVEFSGQHPSDDSAVIRIAFVPKTVSFKLKD